MGESDSATMRGIDIFIFSGVCPAAVAVTLVALCRQSLYPGFPSTSWVTLALAGAGTFLVYNVDRLRDLTRDRGSSPARTAFVERNQRVLIGLCVAAALTSALCAWSQPPWAWLLLGIAFGLGIFHRRLKGHPAFGILYVALAWVIVVVGLPVVQGPPGSHLGADIALTAATLGFVIAANLVGSELREAEPGPSTDTRLKTARFLALGGLLVSWMAPDPLLPIALANLVALLFFRPSERYGLGVLDGAILAGALIGLMMG
jgi:hypothetical protein